MGNPEILPGAEPFLFEGGEVGVLVSHGFTGCPQSMRPLGEALAKEGGFTVLGPRLAGHGTSPDDMATTGTEDWIRSLEAAMDELRERCKVIFITGLSMGGTLSLYMAARYPGVFAGTMPINGAVVGTSPDAADAAYAPDTPPTIPGVGGDIKKEGAVELAYDTVPIHCLREIFSLLAVTRELLPRVACPTLIFQSPEDHVVPFENGKLILESIGAPEKRLVVLRDSYHVATLDNDADRIIAEAVAFIRARV